MSGDKIFNEVTPKLPGEPKGKQVPPIGAIMPGSFAK